MSKTDAYRPPARLLALDHANKTGNYAVLRDLGSPEFKVNTDALLAKLFASQGKCKSFRRRRDRAAAHPCCRNSRRTG